MKMNMRVNRGDRYDSLFQYYAGIHGLDWLLLKAQVKAESNFNPAAKSRVGALGLAQFMPATWKEWAGKSAADIAMLQDPLNPEAAIAAQSNYMAWLITQTAGELRYALAAYNYGIGRVKKHLGRRYEESERYFPKETVDYVNKIVKTFNIYLSERGQKSEL